MSHRRARHLNPRSANVAMWYDAANQTPQADNTALTTFTDSGPFGYHHTTATQSWKPTYRTSIRASRPGVTFNTSQLNGSYPLEFAQNTNTWTILLSLTMNGTNNGQRMFGVASGFTITLREGANARWGWGTQYDSAFANAYFADANSTLAAGGHYVVGVRTVAKNNSDFYLNNAPDGSTTRPFNNWNSTLGGDANNSLTARCTLYSMLVFRYALPVPLMRRFAHSAARLNKSSCS
jgi:hypothetical protein